MSSKQIDWPRHYTATHRQDCTFISEELRRLDIREARLARQADISPATVNQVLAGSYPSSVKKHLEQMGRALDLLVAQQKKRNQLPFVKTGVWEVVLDVCEEARENAHKDGIGLITGYVGVGKSTALKYYASEYPGVLYLRGSDGMTKSELLERICELLHIPAFERSTIARKLTLIKRHLRGSGKLLIFDEAGRALPKCLEVLRDISDDTETALVFAGREFLWYRLSDPEGKFGEIASRILSWQKPITCLSSDDVHALIKVGLPKLKKSKVIEEVFKSSENNGRLLDHLIDKLDTWADNQDEGYDALTPDVVRAIYTNFVRPKVPTWRRHNAPEQAGGNHGTSS